MQWKQEYEVKWVEAEACHVLKVMLKVRQVRKTALVQSKNLRKHRISLTLGLVRLKKKV